MRSVDRFLEGVMDASRFISWGVTSQRYTTLLRLGRPSFVDGERRASKRGENYA